MKTETIMADDSPRNVTRRRVLQVAAGSLAAPIILPGRLFARSAPSNALRLGAIGTGRMGLADLKSCLRRGLDPEINARVVAVCDVDRKRAERAKSEVEKIYADRLGAEGLPQVDVYGDFRQLLARKDIDGVTISTPDFWHAPIALATGNAKKDMYVQKPITYSIAEGQKLLRAVRKNGVILQVGSQQRSDPRFRQACELVRNSRIGQLRRIIVQLPQDKGTGDPTKAPVPDGLDYDMWLGPTPEVPYAEDRVHPQKGYGRPGWLQIERYCRGMITGWGSHMIDIAQWGHGGDRDSGPVEIQATAEFPDRGLFDVHTRFRAEGRYEDGVVLVVETGSPAGVRFEGAKGWIFVRRGGIQAEPAAILKERVGEDERRLQVSEDHYRNFLECMRSRRQPICPIEIGHRSNSVCVITHIAMKLGRKLRWDPAAERFMKDDQANGMLDYDHRAPWTM